MLSKDSEWYHEAQQYAEDAAERGGVNDAPQEPPTCPECGAEFDNGECPKCGFPYRPAAYVPPVGYSNPTDDLDPPF